MTSGGEACERHYIVAANGGDHHPSYPFPSLPLYSSFCFLLPPFILLLPAMPHNPTAGGTPAAMPLCPPSTPVAPPHPS
jgi:hypothetical protein